MALVVAVSVALFGNIVGIVLVWWFVDWFAQRKGRWKFAESFACRCQHSIRRGFRECAYHKRLAQTDLAALTDTTPCPHEARVAELEEALKKAAVMYCGQHRAGGKRDECSGMITAGRMCWMHAALTAAAAG
jgi:hypothetical protein